MNLRHRKVFSTEQAMERELGFLTRLHPYLGFPKVLNAGRMGPDGKWWFDCAMAGREIGAYYLRGGMLSVIGSQLAALVRCLEREGIRHRDITEHNVLWHPEQGVTLIDFGAAIWTETEPNVPPERYPNDGHWYCETSDLSQIDIMIASLGTREFEGRKRPEPL